MTTVLLHYVEPRRFHPRPFDRNGCSFGFSYYARPGALVSDLWREAASIVHRGLYGWAAADTWNLDAHIVRVLPQMLRHLADHTHGFPLWMEMDTAAGGSEPQSLTENPLEHIVHAVYTDSEEAFQRQHVYALWQSWLRDHAQAFDDWSQLMEEGWTGPLYPAGYWDTTFAAQVRELGLEAAFNAPGPLDALSEEEKQAALDAWQEKVAQTKRRMHELIDHLEDLWD